MKTPSKEYNAGYQAGLEKARKEAEELKQKEAPEPEVRVEYVDVSTEAFLKAYERGE